MLGSLLRTAACALVLASAVLPARADDQKRQASFLASYGDDKQIFDDEFVKAVKDNLEGRYQNLQVLISACRSGGFADLAFDKWANNQNWSVTTATNSSKDTFNNEGNVATVEGHAGLSYPNGYFHGFTPQWLKKLNDEPDTTAQGLYDFAKVNQHQDGRGDQMPQFKARGTGADAKIHDGVDANLMMFWQSRLDFRKASFALKAYQIFRARGYSHDDIDCAFQDFAGDTIGPADNPMKVERKGDRAAFFQQIDALKTALSNNQQNPPKKKALIYIHSHGNVESRKVTLRDGYMPNTVAQGVLYTPASASLSLDILPDVAGDFFEGTLADDPHLDSVGRPVFRFTSSEETGLSSPVSVSLDGVNIGAVQMNGGSFGGDYELPLSNGALQQMQDLNLLGDGVINVAFGIPTGTFRVATEWDFDIRNLEHWGVGLSGPGLAGEVPEPATIAALAIGAALMSLRRGCVGRSSSYRA